MERRVVITGLGWVTPLGDSIEAVWKRLLASECGIKKTEIFDANTFPSTFSAEVPASLLKTIQQINGAAHAGASRNTHFALAAARAAWQHAGLDTALALDPTGVGIYLGGGEGPLDFHPFATAAVTGCRDDHGNLTSLDTARWANAALKLLNATNEVEQEPNLAGGHLAVEFNAQGPSINTLTACAASTQAIGEATHLIRYGDANVMITGGTHSMIHPLGVTGFSRLTALSTRNDDILTASRPFDRTRDGFVLGEGAGIVILEELVHARERGAPILAEITGFGSTADAFRITDIHEEGRGAIAAMKGALDSAGLGCEDVDYISSHGTGTEENDKIETLAIRTLFDDHAKSVAISSIKSMLGHLIAAAGAVELITCVLAIRDQIVPPTINYQTPDPNCDLDYVPNKSRPMKVKTTLSNSFGFGGQNNALVVQAFEE
ncbi:MAG: beta-ketoacyl-[acyl-carrier-protein] synthase family protein [Phycisphaerales bacterium]|nr:MAG: beta-ketoacyl-[acyl-carrier-protein] synthase family protein [Phycisphaerales bacterium]